MSPLERMVSFPERCLLAAFYSLKRRDIQSGKLNSSTWIQMAAHSSFLDLNTIGLDFAVIPLICMDRHDSKRMIAENRLVAAEASRSEGFDAGKSLVSLTDLLPRELTCVPQLDSERSDPRAKSVTSSALLDCYGRDAIRFLSRFYRICESDVIYDETVGESWNPDLTIRITPVFWVAKTIRGFQFRPESFPVMIRSMLYAQLFREILNNESFQIAEEQVSELETPPEIVDEKERQFLRACYEVLDIQERMLLFSIVYGGLNSDDAAAALNRASSLSSTDPDAHAPSKIETDLLDLWSKVLFH